MLNKVVAATRMVQAVKSTTTIVQKRGINTILEQYTPPRNSLSNGELIAAGFILTGAILGPSIYLATNFQTYNGKHPK